MRNQYMSVKARKLLAAKAAEVGQAQLAEMVGEHSPRCVRRPDQSTVSYWLTGRNPIHARYCVALANILKCAPSEIREDVFYDGQA